MVGCATPYQGRGFSGGYSSIPLASDTQRVTFEANAYTRPEQVEMFLHYRCAELTLRSGQRYFTVLRSENGDRFDEYVTPAASTTVSSRDVAATSSGPVVMTRSQTTYSPGTVYTLVRPARSAVIRMSTGERPSDAFDAAEVVALLRPHVRQASR